MYIIPQNHNQKNVIGYIFTLINILFHYSTLNFNQQTMIFKFWSDLGTL